MKDNRSSAVDILIIVFSLTVLTFLMTPLIMVTTQALMGRQDLVWIVVAILIIALLVTFMLFIPRTNIKYLLMGIFSSIYAALLVFMNITFVPTMKRQAESYESDHVVSAPGGFDPSVADVVFIEKLFWIALVIFIIISIATLAMFITHRVKERKEHTFKIVRS